MREVACSELRDLLDELPTWTGGPGRPRRPDDRSTGQRHVKQGLLGVDTLTVTAPPELDKNTAAGLGYDPEAGRRRLGEILVQHGIAERSLRKVLADQRNDREQREPRDGEDGTRARLGAMLVQRGLASEEQVATALGEVLGREVVDPTQIPVDPEFARRLPRAVAERNQVLLLGDGPRGLRVIAADPTDVLALDDVRRYTGTQRLDVVIATPGQLRGLLDRVWSLDQSTEAVSFVADVPDAGDLADDDPIVTDAPTVRLLDSILADAVRSRASDVHIELQEQSVRVRYRVDGLMRDVVSLPKAVGRVLTARVKVVGGMDIAERRVPQDGRMRLTVDGARVDARVSTMPSVHGEKVVIRLLPGAAALQDLDELGLEPAQAAAVSRALEASQGLVLITVRPGPGRPTPCTRRCGPPSPPSGTW